MGTGEFIKKMDHESINYFKSGAEIAEFFRTTFPMSETEGDKLAGYMKGHGYLLGYRDGKLYRGDLYRGPDKKADGGGQKASGKYVHEDLRGSQGGGVFRSPLFQHCF